MAYVRLGNLAVQLNKPYEDKLKWYTLAHNYLPLRVEPLARLAEHYLFIEVDRPKVPIWFCVEYMPALLYDLCKSTRAAGRRLCTVTKHLYTPLGVLETHLFLEL